MNTKSTWSPSDIEKLRSLFEQNLPYQEIADKLGKTYKATENKLRRLRLKRKNAWTQSEIDYLHELVGSLPHKTLVRAYNRWALEYGYPERSSSNLWEKIHRLKISRRIDSADWYTVSQISDAIGCSVSTVTYWLHHHSRLLKPKGATQNERGLYVVKRSRLRAFLCSRPEIVERYRTTIDLIWLVDLLGGN